VGRILDNDNSFSCSSTYMLSQSITTMFSELKFFLIQLYRCATSDIPAMQGDSQEHQT